MCPNCGEPIPLLRQYFFGLCMLLQKMGGEAVISPYEVLENDDWSSYEIQVYEDVPRAALHVRLHKKEQRKEIECPSVKP